MPSPRRCCWSVLALSLATGAASAQSPIRVETRGADARLVNDLPIASVVLYRIDVDSTTWKVRFGRVPARSAVALVERSGQIVPQRIEPLSPTVGIRTRNPTACRDASTADLQTAIRALEAEASAPGLEGSREAGDIIAAATQLAQLRLDRTRDSLDLKRNSMVDFTLRMQSVGTKSASELAKQIDTDRQESLNQTIEDIGYAAFAYAEAAAAKYEVLSRDADRYKALLENSEKTVAVVRRQIQLIGDEVVVTAAFQDQVADSLAAYARQSGGDLVVGRDARAQRECTQQAGVDDRIVVHSISSNAGLAAVRAEVRFANGARQPVVLRRLTGTTDWFGALSWPPGANRGALRIQTPAGKWIDVSGALDAGRPSLRDIEASLTRNVEQARKRFKEAQFRAQGADHIKSVIIP